MPESIDPTLQEWMYAREVLRRIGFHPDDLFLSIHTNATGTMIAGRVSNTSGGPILSVVIRAQGKEFTWIIGETAVADDKIQHEYEVACARWNNADPAVSSDDGLFASQAFAQRHNLVVALHAKGFLCRQWN